MITKRNSVRCIIILTMVMVLLSLGIGNIAADEDTMGPHFIGGQVFDVDGKTPTGDHVGAYAAVIVEHNGEKSTYVDPNGLEQAEDDSYWFDVTIPAGAWDKGDKYWIWIDGSGWGDENFTCVDHDDTGVNSWEMTRESEWRNVNTGDVNMKPLIAIIFAIILAVVGIIVGLLRPLKLPFTGRPKQPSDLVPGIVITGTAVIPEPLPKEAAAPAAAAPAAPSPAEEKVCDSCGGKMEYIPEYKNWYCYNCKKYPDEEEDLPPPDEPPSSDELEDDKEPPPPKGGE